MVRKQSINPAYLPLEETILRRIVSPGYATVMAIIIATYAMHHLVNLSSVFTFNESYTPKYVPLNRKSPIKKICPPLYTPNSPSLRTVLFICSQMPIPVLLLTLLESFCLTYSKGYRVRETILAEVTPIAELI